MWHRASTCTCWRSQVSRPTPSKSLPVSPGPQVTGLYLLYKISPRILLCNRDPRLVKDIDSLENIQRRSARFTVQDYSRYISVSALLKGLDWSPLKDRRRYPSHFLFKIVKGKVAVQAEGSLAAADSRSRKRHDHKLRHCVCTEQSRNFFYQDSYRSGTPCLTPVSRWILLPPSRSSCAAPLCCWAPWPVDWYPDPAAFYCQTLIRPHLTRIWKSFFFGLKEKIVLI